MITIDRVDPIGIRVADVDRAIAFYNLFGFETMREAENDDVVVMRNSKDVEINIIFNANNTNDNKGPHDPGAEHIRVIREPEP